MTFIDWVTLLSSIVAGGYLIKCRRKMYFSVHDWRILVFHILLMAVCVTAATGAIEGKSGLSIIGVFATIMWLKISRHSWRDGIPEYFIRKR